MWPFRKPKQCPEDTGKHQLQEPEPSPNFGDLERPLNIVQFPPYLHHKFTTSDRTYLNLWRWVLLNFKIFHSVMDHPNTQLNIVVSREINTIVHCYCPVFSTFPCHCYRPSAIELKKFLASQDDQQYHICKFVAG